MFSSSANHHGNKRCSRQQRRQRGRHAGDVGHVVRHEELHDSRMNELDTVSKCGKLMATTAAGDKIVLSSRQSQTDAFAKTQTVS